MKGLLFMNNEDDNANATKRYLRKKYGGIPRDKWDKLSQKRECKFRYNKRNPYTQKLHTKGSLNRELIAMDKAKKH